MTKHRGTVLFVAAVVAIVAGSGPPAVAARSGRAPAVLTADDLLTAVDDAAAALPSFTATDGDIKADPGWIQVKLADTSPATVNGLFEAVAAKVPVTRTDALAGTLGDATGGPGIKLSVVQVPHSLADLLAARDVLSGDAETQLLTDLKVTGYGPDVDTGLLRITVADASDAVVSQLRDRYGADVEVEQSTDTVDTFSDRGHDSIPWYGGTMVLPSGSTLGDCTSGYSVHSPSGINYLVTAGHCFRLNTTVVNLGHIGTPPAPSNAYGTGVTIGKVTNSNFGNSANGFLDVSFINVGAGRSLGAVYSGGYWQADTHRVAGVETHPSFARTYCVDGAYDYERCHLKLDPKEYRVCLLVGGNRTRSCELIGLYDTNGLPVIGPGDSGGPAYYLDSSGAHILGHVTAGTGFRQACPGVAPRRGCIPRPFVTFAGAVQNIHHVSVDIGP